MTKSEKEKYRSESKIAFNNKYPEYEHIKKEFYTISDTIPAARKALGALFRLPEDALLFTVEPYEGFVVRDKTEPMITYERKIKNKLFKLHITSGGIGIKESNN